MAYRRKVVTLMIGTNHCHDPRNYIRPDKAEDVLIGIREVVQELYNRDKLNLSPKGYQAWANALLPILSKFGFED